MTRKFYSRSFVKKIFLASALLISFAPQPGYAFGEPVADSITHGWLSGMSTTLGSILVKLQLIEGNTTGLKAQIQKSSDAITTELKAIQKQNEVLADQAKKMASVDQATTMKGQKTFAYQPLPYPDCLYATAGNNLKNAPVIAAEMIKAAQTTVIDTRFNNKDTISKTRVAFMAETRKKQEAYAVKYGAPMSVYDLVSPKDKDQVMEIALTLFPPPPLRPPVTNPTTEMANWLTMDTANRSIQKYALHNGFNALKKLMPVPGLRANIEDIATQFGTVKETLFNAEEQDGREITYARYCQILKEVLPTDSGFRKQLNTLDMTGLMRVQVNMTIPCQTPQEVMGDLNESIASYSANMSSIPSATALKVKN